MSHVDAATATLADAAKKRAQIPPSMREGIMGVARAWDEAEANHDARYIPQLSARMLDWVTAILGLVPVEAPIDAFSEIGRKLDGRSRRKSA